MAKKRRKQTPKSDARSSSETRMADMLTVVWMLSVFTTLLCEIGSSVTLLFARDNAPLTVLATILMTGAVVIGTLSLMLAAGVLKARREPPPRGITVFALVVGGMPLVVFLLTLLRNVLA